MEYKVEIIEHAGYTESRIFDDEQEARDYYTSYNADRREYIQAAWISVDGYDGWETIEVFDPRGDEIEQCLSSSDSRQTSPEILEAIVRQSDSARSPADIWDAPTYPEALAIWERVTDNGLRDSADYLWGEAGDAWADALGLPNGHHS